MRRVLRIYTLLLKTFISSTLVTLNEINAICYQLRLDEYDQRPPRMRCFKHQKYIHRLHNNHSVDLQSLCHYAKSLN